MASWKDGAAYAPIERPDGFATPMADALPAAEPYASPTPGPMAEPGGFEADAQPPLDALGRAESTNRDPRDEFSVASLSLTHVAGDGATRDPRKGFTLSTSLRGGSEPPPPSGDPLALTTPPPMGSQRPTPGPGSMPAAQPWPQPQLPRAQQRPPALLNPPAPSTDSSRTLCIIGAVVSFFGVFLVAAAPILLLVAAALGMRTRTRTSFLFGFASGFGILALLSQLITGEPGAMGALASIASLAVSVWFIVGAARRI